MNIIFDKAEIISFGKLKNSVTVFSDGINVLEAPNESGKSTLAAFIKYILYGFAGVKNHSVAANEKKLYTPWDSGDISEGKLYFTADNKKYCAYRKTYANKEIFECAERVTGEPAFTDKILGEALFGVGEDVFARTLFVHGLNQSANKDDVLADKLRNIAVSADEQINTQKAVKKLSAARNSLSGRLNSGKIPKLESEYSETVASLNDSVEKRNNALSLREDIASTRALSETDKEKLSALAAERTNIENYEAKRKLININTAKAEMDEAEKDYKKASALLKHKTASDETGLHNKMIGLNTERVAEEKRYDDIAERLKEAEEDLKNEDKIPLDRSQVKKAEKELKKSEKNSKIIFIAAAILFVVGLSVYFIFKNAFFLVAAALSLILAVWGCTVLARPAATARSFGLSGAKELKKLISGFPAYELRIAEKTRKVESLRASADESAAKIKKLKTELDEIITDYADVSGDDDYERIRSVLNISAESGKKLAVFRAKKEAYENILGDNDISELESLAADAKEPDRTRAQVDRDINFYKKQYDELSEKLRRLELDLNYCEAKSGDPAVLVGKRDALAAAIKNLNLKYNAFGIAAETINEASEYMKSMIAPQIGSRASIYFDSATDGKYKNIEVDTKLAMTYGNDIQRSAEYLSAGTRDSAYLCLKFALADMLFGSSKVPLILDEAFDRLDAERLSMMSRSLLKASEEHQIIIFTHSHRESASFAENNINYTAINISEAK